MSLETIPFTFKEDKFSSGFGNFVLICLFFTWLSLIFDQARKDTDTVLHLNKSGHKMLNSDNLQGAA